MSDEAVKNIAAGLTIAVGGVVPAIAIARIAAAALEALGRNPEASPTITTNLITAIAFAEAIAIYALVIALVIKFV
jgi:F-type H+-transporting ATPase subunit c